MLRVPQSSVFGASKVYLDAIQVNIDAAMDYPSRVEMAASAWDKKNANIFQTLRDTLADLCQGARRCHYCEDSAADEVEHIWPKKFYPEKTFIWSNYLFACGPCNGSNKRDQFAIFDPTGQFLELKRGRQEIPIEPAVGGSVFLDPRIDDPLNFIELDLTTGIFVPSALPGSLNYVRAEYTIKILGLNKRDYLIRARRNAYASYLDAAHQYVVRKVAGEPADEIRQRARDISERHHPSVWAEMKRLSTMPAHSKFFQAAPELLSC